MATVAPVQPDTFDDAAAALGAATAAGRRVRIVGSGTKLGWGSPGDAADLELSTARLDRVVEHNAGDLTATLQAGVPLTAAQRMFAAAGQMLALDPPLAGAQGAGPGATIGGIVATGDSGPMRHRYGAPRDLVVGMTVALSDGTIARAGGRVIKNVAGYDLAKLFSGAYGTLGLILSVNVRLHPLPQATATARGVATNAAVLARAAAALAAAPLEFEALDVGWRAGHGALLARCAGPEARRRAARAARLMADHGLSDTAADEDDGPLWERQRTAQRSATAAVVRVAARPSGLAGVLEAVQACDGSLVGRAALGSSYATVDPAAVARLREALPAGCRAVVLDAPTPPADPWGPAADAAALALMRRVKARFDPAGTCNPGVFVGGI